MLISRDKLDAIRFILATALRGRRRRFVAILLLGAVASLMGGLGIGVMVPLASAALGQQTDGNNAVTEITARILGVVHLEPSLFVLTVLLVSLFTAKAVVQFGARFLLAHLSAQYEERMRGEMLAGTLAMDWPAIAQQKIGYLERVIVDDTTRAGEVFKRTVTFFLLALSLAAYAIVALTISATVTVLTAVIGMSVFLALRPLYRRSRKASKAVIDEEKNIAHLVGGILGNGKTVKAFSVSDQLLEGGTDTFRRLSKAKSHLALFQHGIGPLFEPLAAIFIAGLFLFSDMKGVDIVAFGAVIYLVQKLFQFMQSAQENLHLVNESLPSAQALARYQTWYATHRERSGGKRIQQIVRGIALDAVTFTYEAGRSALKSISTNIPRGTFVGVVGVSGSGKTTLVDILLGLLKPTSGAVLVDGTNLDAVDLASWRAIVGYVPQDVILFDGTITENICFFDSSCTHEDVERAASQAGISDFIRSLPDGYGTLLGERGLGLSGGQRQRVALARALRRNPQLLILDEATSALDDSSAQQIRETVESLRGSTMIIWISHTEANVVSADTIFRLREGELTIA